PPPPRGPGPAGAGRAGGRRAADPRGCRGPAGEPDPPPPAAGLLGPHPGDPFPGGLLVPALLSHRFLPLFRLGQLGRTAAGGRGCRGGSRGNRPGGTRGWAPSRRVARTV